MNLLSLFFLDWGIRCISQNYKINVFCLFSECTPLHYAAKSSNLEMVRLLLENGADLRAADRHGWSVLHYAVRQDQYQIGLLKFEIQKIFSFFVDLPYLQNITRKNYTILLLLCTMQLKKEGYSLKSYDFQFLST